MQSRNELGELFQKHNKLGKGAEVGCYLADFSKIISNNYTGIIFAIDYFDKDDFLYCEDMEKSARKNIEGTKIAILKGKSTEVAERFNDGSLDWVYIDANHTYESAKEDIATWMPKVRKGGIVSGHDYIKDYKVSGIEFGVWRAVDELGITFNLIHDTQSGADFASWWFIK
jgi:hypothetical protein